MASIHTRKKRSVRDAGEGVPALGGRKGSDAPPLRGAPRGTFCRVLPYCHSPDPSPPRRQPRSLPGTSWLHFLGPPLSVGSPWRGCSLQGCSLEVASKMSSGNPAPGPRGSRPAHRAAHWHSAHTARRGALRVKQGRATRGLRLPAPRAAFRGLRRPPTARPALHAGETDEKIKNPR